eukprot:PhF_6_TR29152/c0_g1_i1/m.42603/K13247/CRYL1; L-gulonate 3-dehydrogenase
MSSGVVVGILGCGLVGRCWAVVFARGGCQVVMYDADAKQRQVTKSQIESMLPALEKYNALGGKTPQQILSSIALVDTVQAIFTQYPQVSHIQECVPENIDLKRKVFQQLDAIAPVSQTLTLASSTSNLPCSSWSQDMKRCRSQCLVAHPINPPHCIPLVEVVPSPYTNPIIVQRTIALMKQIGQVPVLLKKRGPGVCGQQAAVRVTGGSIHAC